MTEDNDKQQGESTFIMQAVDMRKELEDIAAHWERLLGERGEGLYASFNIGPEDARTFRRYVDITTKLIEKAWRYEELCK